MADNALAGFGRGLDVVGEGPATVVLLVTAVLMPVYKLLLARGRPA